MNISKSLCVYLLSFEALADHCALEYAGASTFVNYGNSSFYVGGWVLPQSSSTGRVEGTQSC